MGTPCQGPAHSPEPSTEPPAPPTAQRIGSTTRVRAQGPPPHHQAEWIRLLRCLLQRAQLGIRSCLWGQRQVDPSPIAPGGNVDDHDAAAKPNDGLIEGTRGSASVLWQERSPMTSISANWQAQQHRLQSQGPGL
mmetsp:Transcript_14045/g.40089  ORF Transcript_14045/g.40089 Transcript_14045/m.40089 type:complete len:135 (+) Transcript_14045:909-1313(+)